MRQDCSLRVAVGIIKNPAGEVLISYRDESAHQGGLWEFPGGKFEQGETPRQALHRELREELNISIEKATPAIKIHHHYPDRTVLLDVWHVDEFSGELMPCEGQPLKWVMPEDLPDYSFPAANLPIVNVSRLPEYYAILDGRDVNKLETDLQKILNNGVKLVQLRAKSLAAKELNKFYKLAYSMCKNHGASLLLNSAHLQNGSFNGDGIHLTSQHLMELDKKPDKPGWMAASCHTEDELEHAEKIGVDFVVLAPVLKTSTHPDAEPLGWKLFEELVSCVNIPVFALGGMKNEDVEKAKNAGGQGIAGITVFIEL